LSIKQHVDFLKSFPKTTNLLPAFLVIGVIVATALLLLIISLVMVMNQRSADNLLKNVKSEQEQASLAFQKMAEAYPLFASDTPFVTKVADFEKLVKEKLAQVDELTHATYRKPFSEYLFTLSQVTPTGLWLYNIHVDQNDSNISLSGYALEPLLVSNFVQKIQTSPPFTGNSFELIAVKKTPDGLNQFEVANEKLINKDLKYEEKAE